MAAAVSSHFGCLLLGAAVSLASLAAYDELFPAGLLLVVAASLATWARLWMSRRPRLSAAFVVGWLAVFAAALVGRPEGDYVLAGDTAGYAMVAVACGHVALGVVSLAAGRRRAA